MKKVRVTSGIGDSELSWLGGDGVDAEEEEEEKEEEKLEIDMEPFAKCAQEGAQEVSVEKWRHADWHAAGEVMQGVLHGRIKGESYNGFEVWEVGSGMRWSFWW